MTIKSLSLLSPKRVVILSFWLVLLTVPVISFGINWDEIIGNIIYFVFFWPYVLWMQVEMWILPIVAQYDDFVREAKVVETWKIMRDLANMFFIVILLIMSLGTILQIKSYGYKNLLSSILIMAILVNFSRSIIGLAVDFVQIIMLTFVAAWKDVMAANFQTALGLSGTLNIRGGDGIDNFDWSDFIAGIFLGGVMLIVAVVIIGAFIAILVGRIVTIWILTILSPLAFLAYTFPGSKKYYSQWEQELTKSLIIGPALAFFLWLTFTITGDGQISKSIVNENARSGIATTAIRTQTGGTTNVADSLGGGGPTKATTIDSLLNYIVAIALLMAGLKFASDSGVAGAGVARSGLGKLQSKMSKAAATAGKAFDYTVNKPYELAWKGSTGEGGIKGGLSAGRGLGGKILAKSGIAPVKRFGMRQQASEQERKGREVAAVAKSADRIVDEKERQKYLETYLTQGGGRARGVEGSRAAQVLLDRETAKSANPIAAQDARNMMTRAKEVGDKDMIAKLRSRSAAVHDADSLSRLIEEKGPDALKNMNLEGAGDEIINAITDLLDGDELQKAFGGMSKSLREGGMRAIQTSLTSGALGPASDIDVEGSKVNKARALQMKYDGKNADLATQYATLSSDRKNQLLRAAKMDGTDMLKISHDPAAGATPQQIAMFNDVAGRANQSQVSSMLANTSNVNDVKAITAAQVRAGNIQLMANNNQTAGHIQDSDVQHYFRSSGAMTSAADRKRLAMQNLQHAHLAYTGFSTEFTTFLEGLTIEQLKKCDQQQLQLKKTAVNRETQDRFKTLGIV